MQQIMLFAAAVALLALAALAIRAYFLVKRTHTLLDQVGKLLEAEVTDVVRTLGGAARGVEQAVGKLDKGLEALSSTLQRVDHVTQKLEPESLAHTVGRPALAKLAAWVGGLRKGLARVRRGRGGAVEASAADAEDVTES